MPLRVFGLIAALSLSASAARKSSVPVREVQRASSAAMSASGTAPTCASGSPCHMDYYGGKVIPNAKVYVVNWTANVAPGGDLGAFFDVVTNSSYLDWLNEYDTDITPTGSGGAATGTNQLIGRGVYAGSFTITPSSGNATSACPSSAPSGSTCITDKQIQSELDAQIAAGHLPAPDQNALYMTYFPPKTFISDSQGTGSCVAGGFCGYHGTAKNASREFYYGVLPDHGAGSGCDTGCGAGTSFENLTSTSSHELCEAITDAEVGIATTNAGLGWYDQKNGEVGDMCHGTSQVGDATVGFFTVQNIFSNLVAATNPTLACVASRTAADDFSVSLAANKQKVTGGSSISVPIATQVTAGSPGTLTLSFSNLPAHVTGSLDNTSVSAGSSATLTLTADSGAVALAGALVQIQARTGSVVHTAGLLLDVAAGGAITSDFSLAITPPPGGTTIAAGSSADYTVTTSAIGAFNSSISLAASGLPAGVHAAFSPASVAPGQSSTLTLSVDAGTPTTASTNFTVTGTASSGSQQATSTVAVTGADDFSLSLSPAAVTVAPGRSAQVQVATAVVSGAAQPVALSASGLPSGVTASFSPASVSAGGASVLTLSAASAAPLVNSAAYTVVGASGSKTHSAGATLTVAPAGAPTVSITSPSDGGTVSGAVEIDAVASVATGATLLKVDLLVDGAVVASLAHSPAQGFWQSTDTADGPHSVSARAVDSNGGSTLSAPVAITVLNNTSSGPAKDPSGGCASGGAGLSALFGLLVTLRRRRVT